MGNDQISGDSGQDYLNGEGDDDTLMGGDGGDQLHGGAGHDLLEGGSGADTLEDFSGIDTLNGGGGNDFVNSGSTHQYDVTFLNGGDGDDTLRGADASNTFTGGTGADRFQIEGVAASGHDVITDFNVQYEWLGGPRDKIAFKGWFSDYTEMMKQARQTAEGVVITDNDVKTLTLKGVLKDTLHAYHFEFFV